jgi:hypothetical protein
VNDFCVSYSFSACLFLIEINNTENNSLTSAIRCPAHGVHFNAPKIAFAKYSVHHVFVILFNAAQSSVILLKKTFSSM